MMEYETAKMQRAAASWLHDRILKCEHLEGAGQGLDNCSNIDRHMESAGWLVAAMVPAITQDVVIPARADERDKIAHYILAELVCCDIFERMEAAGQADDLAKISANDPNGQWHQLRWGPEYHAMCRYAGWAASLAKEGPKHDTRGAVRPPV